MASFCNYEPEIIERINGSVSNSDGKRALYRYQIDKGEIAKPKLDLTRPEILESPGEPDENQGRGNSRGYEINNVVESEGSCKTELSVTSCESKEDMNSFLDDREETLLQKETDADSRCKIRTQNSGPSVPEGLRGNAKQKNTKQNIVGIRETKGVNVNKNPYAKLTSKRNLGSVNRFEKCTVNSFKKNPTEHDSSDIHGNSTTSIVEVSDRFEATSTQNESTVTKAYSSSNVSCRYSIVVSETHDEFETECLGTDAQASNVTQHRNNEARLNSNCALNCEANISEKSLRSLQTQSKPASSLTPVGWEDASRNRLSVDKGLMLVQTSSVCVVVPQDTVPRRLRKPVNVVRRKCATLIMNPMFDWFITCVIFLNTVVMAMEYYGMNKKLENTLDNINLVSIKTRLPPASVRHQGWNKYRTSGTFAPRTFSSFSFIFRTFSFWVRVKE